MLSLYQIYYSQNYYNQKKWNISFPISDNFASKSAFLTISLTLAKLVVLGISPLVSFILALRDAIVANLVMSGILSSIS